MAAKHGDKKRPALVDAATVRDGSRYLGVGSVPAAKQIADDERLNDVVGIVIRAGPIRAEASAYRLVAKPLARKIDHDLPQVLIAPSLQAQKPWSEHLSTDAVELAVPRHVPQRARGLARRRTR